MTADNDPFRPFELNRRLFSTSLVWKAHSAVSLGLKKDFYFKNSVKLFHEDSIDSNIFRPKHNTISLQNQNCFFFFFENN